MTDYTKEAEELYPSEYRNSADIYNKADLADAKQAAHIAARQQSAAEIDRLRGLIKVAHDTGYFNGASYIEESKWEESWQQFKTENNIQ